MLGRSLAYDWAQHDIRVNVLAPGVVRTAMTAASFADPEKYRSFLDDIPMGRVAEVGEMASVAVFLTLGRGRLHDGRVRAGGRGLARVTRHASDGHHPL